MDSRSFTAEFGRAIKRTAVVALLERGDTTIDAQRLTRALEAVVRANYDQIRGEWADAGAVGSDDLARSLLGAQAAWLASQAVQEYDRSQGGVR